MMMNSCVCLPTSFSTGNSESFASINIPLVAVWLSTLSDDEVERFHTLKKAFSEEQRAKDELIDAADYDLFIDARNIEKERSQRDRDWAELFDRHVLMQKEERYQQFANTLLGTLFIYPSFLVFSKKLYDYVASDKVWKSSGSCSEKTHGQAIQTALSF